MSFSEYFKRDLKEIYQLSKGFPKLLFKMALWPLYLYKAHETDSFDQFYLFFAAMWIYPMCLGSFFKGYLIWFMTISWTGIFISMYAADYHKWKKKEEKK